MVRKDSKNNYHIMRDSKKAFLLILLLIIANLLLSKIDLYAEKYSFCEFLNIKNTNGLSLIEEKNLYCENKSVIKYKIYSIEDTDKFNKLTLSNKNKCDNLLISNDTRFRVIMSHLNLDNYLYYLPNRNIYTKLRIKKVLNKEQVYNKDLLGWDFIIIDKDINKLFLVTYEKTKNKLI